jgi:hypothetical protein
MVSYRLTRTSLLTIIVVALVCLTGMATTSHTASAHAASQSSQSTVNQSPQLTGQLMVHGRTYTLTPGAPLKVPITLPDGSAGYLVGTIGVIGSSSTVAVRPAVVAQNGVAPLTVTCNTVYVGMETQNGIGGLETQFVLYQYYCWDGSQITGYHQPYSKEASGWGWSFNQSYVVLNRISSTAGVSSAGFRFNGPLGIGCVSGYEELDFFDTGRVVPIGKWESEFGC